MYLVSCCCANSLVYTQDSSHVLKEEATIYLKMLCPLVKQDCHEREALSVLFHIHTHRIG